MPLCCARFNNSDDAVAFIRALNFICRYFCILEIAISYFLLLFKSNNYVYLLCCPCRADAESWAGGSFPTHLAGAHSPMRY